MASNQALEAAHRERLSSFHAALRKHAKLMLQERRDELQPTDFDEVFTTAMELKRRARELGISDANIRLLLEEETRSLLIEL